MHIAFTIASLEMGGAEHVLTLMANYWARAGRKVTIITYDDGSRPAFYELHPAVRRMAMNNAQPYGGLSRALIRNARRVADLRTTLKEVRPDCLISIGEINGVRAVPAACGLAIPVIITEHTDDKELRSGKNGWIWHLLRRMVYPLADHITVLSREAKERLSSEVQKKTSIIPNPVDFAWVEVAEESSPAFDLPPRFIGAMGRFVKPKRFDLLIDAFARLAPHDDCCLVLVGDGPLRPELKAQVRSLGLDERVIMPGIMRNPWRVLRHARMFVLSSECETFGLVIVEAMACGVPVISFDCPSGPRRLIRDGMDGLLVPPLDAEALAGAISRLLRDDDLRRRMAEWCVEARERFGTEHVMAKWDELIRSVCGLPRHSSEGSASATSGTH